MGGTEEYRHTVEGVMDQEHVFAEENLPAFALGALEEEESARVREHLKSCPQCQATYHSYERVATALAYAAPLYDPPPYLRNVIRALIVSQSTQPSAPFEERGKMWKSLGQMSRFLLVITILLAFGLTGWNLTLHQRLSAMQDEMVSAQEMGEVLMDYMKNPDAYDSYIISGRASSPSPRALVVRDRTHERFLLVLEDLPTDVGPAYFIWLVDATGRHIPVKKVRCNGDGRAVLMFESPMPMEMIRGIRVTPVGREDASPILDGHFPQDQGYPGLLASNAL